MSYVGDPDDPGYLRKTWRFNDPSRSQNVTLSNLLSASISLETQRWQPHMLRVCYRSFSLYVFFLSDVKKSMTQKHVG